MNDKPYWRNGNTWICPNHLPSVKLPREIHSCWFSRCKSERPSTIGVTGLTLIYPTRVEELCEWHKCKQANGKQALKIKGRKYCSHKCRKNKARWAYTQRKKKKIA